MKGIYGCEQETQIEGWWKLGDYEFSRCPLKIVDYGIYEYIKAYRKYERGFLPTNDGWLEQPAKFIDTMEMIEALNNRVCEQKAKERKR